MRAHSAESAFFIIMSIFPLLMLLLTFLKFTSVTPEDLLETIENITPVDITDIVKPMVDSIYEHTPVLVSGTALALFWTSGRSVLGLMDGLNTIYRIRENRNYILLRLRAAGYTVVLIIAFCVILFIMALGYSAQEYVNRRVIVFRYIPRIGTVIPVILSIVLLAVLFLLMFTFLPNRRMKIKTQIPGAIFASLSWYLFTYIFSFFLNFSSRLSTVYGSLTTLVVIMLWLYVSMYLVFLGAEINHYLMAPELFSPQEISSPETEAKDES